jgi:hypothetical protein
MAKYKAAQEAVGLFSSYLDISRREGRINFSVYKFINYSELNGKSGRLIFSCHPNSKRKNLVEISITHRKHRSQSNQFSSEKEHIAVK